MEQNNENKTRNAYGNRVKTQEEAAAEASEKVNHAVQKFVSGTSQASEDLYHKFTSSESSYGGYSSNEHASTFIDTSKVDTDNEGDAWYEKLHTSQQQAYGHAENPYNNYPQGRYEQQSSQELHQASLMRSDKASSGEPLSSSLGSGQDAGKYGSGQNYGGEKVNIVNDTLSVDGLGENGYYNAGYLDTNSLRQAAVNTVTDQYQESDAYQGAKEIKAKTDMMGLGGLSSAASGMDAKFSVANALYADNHMVVDNARHRRLARHSQKVNEVYAEYQKRLENPNLNVAERQELEKKLIQARENAAKAGDALSSYENRNQIRGMKVTASDMQSIFGDKYIVSTNRTGNILHDYRNNMQLLERYLQKYNINARNLDVAEIEAAFQGNTAGAQAKAAAKRFVDGRYKIYLTGSLSDALNQNASDPTGKSMSVFLEDMESRDPEKARQMKAVLTEYAYLKNQQPHIKQMKQGSFMNSAKSVVGEALSDSDAAKGYNVAKATINTAAAAGNLVKGMGGTLASAGSVSIEKFLNGKDKKKLEETEKVKAAAGPQNAAKYSTDIEEINKKIAQRSEKFTKFREGADWLAKTDTSDMAKVGLGRVGKMVSDKTGFTAVRAKVNEKYAKAATSKAGKALGKTLNVVRSPFRTVNFLKLKARKLMLIAGLILLLIMLALVIAVWICFTVQNFMPDSSIADYTWDMPNSNMQRAIDYLYEYQIAYNTNICKADPHSEYIDKGIPESWNLGDKVHVTEKDADGNVVSTYTDTTKSVNNQMTAVYKGGDLKGYNLSHYWGPKDRTYTATVDLGDFDEATGTGTHDYHDINIYGGYAGIGTGSCSDFIGSYDGGFKAPGQSFDFDIDESSPGMAGVQDLINTDVTVDFEYKGSHYSYQYTADKVGKYITTEGDSVYYDTEMFYRAMSCMAFSLTDMDQENYKFYRKYMKHIFDQIMDDAVVTMDAEFYPDPSHKVKFKFNGESDLAAYTFDQEPIEADAWQERTTIHVWIDDCGIQDMMKLDRSDPKYAGTPKYFDVVANESTHYTENVQFKDGERTRKWKGWYEESNKQYYDVNHNPIEIQKYEGQEDIMSDEMLQAVTIYDLDDVDFGELFPGLVLPGEFMTAFSDEEIDSIVHEMTETQEIETPVGLDDLKSLRKNMVEAALKEVGKHKYAYGGGHGNYDINNPPNGIDCSGFMSYITAVTGIDRKLSPKDTVAFAKNYKQVAFNGDWDTIQPGTMIIKSGKGGNQDHIVMYIGKVQISELGDTKPEPHCVECTTHTYRSGSLAGKTISGTQITEASRMNYIANNYKVAIDPAQGRS